MGVLQQSTLLPGVARGQYQAPPPLIPLSGQCLTPNLWLPPYQLPSCVQAQPVIAPQPAVGQVVGGITLQPPRSTVSLPQIDGLPSPALSVSSTTSASSSLSLSPLQQQAPPSASAAPLRLDDPPLFFKKTDASPEKGPKNEIVEHSDHSPQSNSHEHRDHGEGMPKSENVLSVQLLVN